MAEQTKEIRFETSHVNGIQVHTLPTHKFKTTTIVVMIQQALSQEFVTKTSLLAQLMKRATARFKETKALREHLDFLYGAIFDVDVVKKGERQILHVYLEVPNEKYLSEQTPLLEQAFQFLGDVMTRPYVENGAFAEKFVKAEKEALRKRIESIIDDKMKYANHRITQEMFKGEPYALLVNGRVEDLPGITGESLFDYYQDMIAKNPIDIFVVGDVEPTAIQGHVQKHIPLTRSNPVTLPYTQEHKDVHEIREVVDRLDVSQAKLNIGCRTHISYKDDDYPALLVTNGVLGGFPHSKLFINVREKASLAYYAVSRLESHKGILMIMSGIDAANYEKAVGIIKEQVELVRKGEITEIEMNQTKATLMNQFTELLDSARMMIDFAYNGVLSGRPRTLGELLEQIKQIGIDDVVHAANKIELDTIYLLRDKKGSV